MESRHLHEIMRNRFHVLDEARQIRVNDRMHITFSIGVGDGASSLAESENSPDSLWIWHWDAAATRLL